MVAPKVLLSGIGLIGIAGAMVQFGPSIFSNNPSDDSVSSRKSYVLGTILEKSTSNFPEKLIDQNKKNYECTAEIDGIVKELKTCNILKTKLLTSDAKNVKISDAIKNQENILKNSSDVVDGEKLIVEIDESEYKSLSESTKISIRQKDSQIEYFSIQINKKLSNDDLTKTNLILAKITSSNFNSSSSLGSLDCQIGSNNTHINCQIFSLNPEIQANSTDLSIVASKLGTTTNICNHSDFKTDRLVLIKLNSSISETNISNEDIKVFMRNDATPSPGNQKAVLQYKKSIICDLDLTSDICPEYKYLVVTSSTENDVTAPSPNTFTSSTGSVKNYKCQFKNTSSASIEDETCELFQTNTDNKIINLYMMSKNPDSLKVTTNPEASKKYILKIKSSKYSEILDSDKSIDLIYKADTTKKFIKLTPDYEIKKSVNQFKTNKILVKVKTSKTVTAASTPSITCKLKPGQTDMNNCKVFKFATDPSSLSSLEISGTSKLTKITTTDNNITAGKYLVIEIEGDNNYKTEKELKASLPEIYITTTTSSQNTQTLLFETEYVNSYVGTISDSSSAITSNLLKIKESPQDYLVIVHNSSSSDQPSDELAAGSDKNYKCTATINSTTYTDNTCSLISLSGTEENSINIKNITDSNTLVINKSDFVKNKYFKLVINEPLFMSQNFSDSQTITIASNKTDEPNNNKNFGTVKVISKFFYDRHEGSANWFLAKSSANVTASDTPTSFKCQYNGDSSYTACDIYKSSTSLTDNSNKQWNLSSFTKTTSKDDLALDKFLIVKLTDQKKSISDIASKTIKITKEDGSTPLTTLNVVVPLHVNLNTDNTQIEGKPLVLA